MGLQFVQRVALDSNKSRPLVLISCRRQIAQPAHVRRLTIRGRLVQPYFLSSPGGHDAQELVPQL